MAIFCSFTVVAICEYDGYIYNKDGIDVHALLEYEHKSGSICGFDGAETNEDSLKVRLLDPPPPNAVFWSA